MNESTHTLLSLVRAHGIKSIALCLALYCQPGNLYCQTSAATNRPTQRAVLAPPNPGLVRLAYITNQLALVDRQLNELGKDWAKEDKLEELKRAAGRPMSPEAKFARHKARDKAAKPLEARRAALKLEEFQVRELYKIPTKSKKPK